MIEDKPGITAGRTQVSKISFGEFGRFPVPVFRFAPTPQNQVVKLPVQYSAGSTYNAQKWTVTGHFARRLNGSEYHAGAEYRFGILAFRGGGRYIKDVFNPTGGMGVNLTSHFGIDAAVFSNSANAQQDRRFSTAISLRFQ